MHYNIILYHCSYKNGLQLIIAVLKIQFSSVRHSSVPAWCGKRSTRMWPGGQDSTTMLVMLKAEKWNQTTQWHVSWTIPKHCSFRGQFLFYFIGFLIRFSHLLSEQLICPWTTAQSSEGLGQLFLSHNTNTEKVHKIRRVHVFYKKSKLRWNWISFLLRHQK